jgi:hypothetical protein
MTSANLIPVFRKDLRKRRTRIRRWGLLCAGYGVFLLMTYGTCHALMSTGDRNLPAELDDVSERIRRSKLAISSLQRRLQTAQLELEANRAVGNQPDWSVLLAALSAGLGDDVFLRGCTLEPLEPSQGVKDGDGSDTPDVVAAGQREYVLKLNGYGRSQAAVSQIVLRLESHPLFDEVRIVKTSREPLLTSNAIAFQLRCSLGKEKPRTQ